LELLSQAPELAVLDVLEAATQAASLALRCAHPELEQADFAAAPHLPSVQSSMADAILTLLPPLRQSLRRYRTLLVTQQLWAGYAPVSEDLGF
jgi:hypothetical protein